jgi:hypothetical protein
MVSVIIPAEQEEPALIDTLAALVEGVAEGVLRDCVVVSATKSAIFARSTDAAGCLLVIEPGSRDALIRHGAHLVRSDYALVIPPGLIPSGPWMTELTEFLDERPRPDEAAIFPYQARRGFRALVAGVMVNLSSRVTGRPHPLHGFIAPTSRLREWPSHAMRFRTLDARMLDRRLRSPLQA